MENRPLQGLSKDRLSRLVFPHPVAVFMRDKRCSKDNDPTDKNKSTIGHLVANPQHPRFGIAEISCNGRNVVSVLVVYFAAYC